MCNTPLSLYPARHQHRWPQAPARMPCTSIIASMQGQESTRPARSCASLERFAVKGTSAAGEKCRSVSCASGAWSHAEHSIRLTDSKSSATMEFVSPYWSVTMEGPTTRYSFSFSSKALLRLHTSLHIVS